MTAGIWPPSPGWARVGLRTQDTLERMRQRSSSDSRPFWRDSASVDTTSPNVNWYASGHGVPVAAVLAQRVLQQDRRQASFSRGPVSQVDAVDAGQRRYSGNAMTTSTSHSTIPSGHPSRSHGLGPSSDLSPVVSLAQKGLEPLSEQWDCGTTRFGHIPRTDKGWWMGVLRNLAITHAPRHWRRRRYHLLLWNLGGPWPSIRTTESSSPSCSHLIEPTSR